MKTFKRFSRFLLILIAILSPFLNAYSQNSENFDMPVKTDLPLGDWTVSFHSYQGEDFLDVPAVVSSVTSRKGAVEKFSLVNISNKPIKALKVRWMIYESEDRSKISAEGRTRQLRFVSPFLPGIKGNISFAVVSMLDVEKALGKSDLSRKNILIDIVVDWVEFSDGSSWDKSEGNFRDINYEISSKMTFSLNCAKQKCEGSPSTTVVGGVVYRCGSSTLNENCTNSSNAESCTNTSCNSSGGGGTDLPTEPVEN